MSSIKRSYFIVVATTASILLLINISKLSTSLFDPTPPSRRRELQTYENYDDISHPISAEKYTHIPLKKNQIFDPPKPETIAGREPILQILSQAGAYLDDKTVASLPLWSEVAHLYGPQPVIIGAKTCKAFRENNINEEKVFLTPSGLFNTGTNYLMELVNKNCDVPMVQNPWWKHSPASMTHAPEHVYNKHYHSEILDHLGVEDKDYTSQILKIMVIKDPFHWIVSMCRRKYNTRWNYSKGNCPNLVTPDGQTTEHTLDFWRPMGLKDDIDKKAAQHVEYNSIVHLWNHWNTEHLLSSTNSPSKKHTHRHPQLVVRYEDLLFHPQLVVNKICTCAGGKMLRDKDEFLHVARTAKNQERMTLFNGLVESMVRYGKEMNRTEGFTVGDVDYCRKHLDLNLMRQFHYSLPPLEGDIGY